MKVSDREVQDRFGLAMQCMQGGNQTGAQALLEQVLSVRPGHFEALHYLGLLHAMAGRLPQGEELIRRALALRPDYAEAHNNHGLVLKNLRQPEAALASFGAAIRLAPQAAAAHFNLGLALEDLGRFEEAAAAYGKAAQLQPNHVEAHNNRGLALQRLGRFAEALGSYEAALRIHPGYAEAHNNRGLMLEEQHRHDEALAAYDQAIALNPALAEVHDHRGNVLQKMRRHEEALASHERAVALKPGYAAAWNNRGNALEKLHRHEEALASLDQAIALAPEFHDAWNNRGNVLEQLGRNDAALAAYERAIALAPEYAEAHYNRGHTLHELGRATEARSEVTTPAPCLDPGFAPAQNNIFMHHFHTLEDLPLIERLGLELAHVNLEREAAERRHAGQGAAFRVQHDLEQLGYLAGQGIRDPLLEAARASLEARRDGRGSAAGYPLDSYLMLHPAAGGIDSCLGDNDWGAIEERYFASTPEMIWLDNLLSPRALEELQRFCLGSTVWKREYPNEYLGAFATQGFLSPLHLRIALELKQKMPRIFGPHRLEQLWAFKYGARMQKGINVHADFARVNLNFWITPDSANLDPESGGLLVYDAPSPPDWHFQKYNESERDIYAFLKERNAGCMKVPYRCNRAVLFNSTLFHETDTIRFKEGYGNRRINITYLFGRGLKTS